MTELLTACADRLSEFTHALHFDAIPHEVRENIALRVLDTVGVAIASTREDFAPPVLGLVEGWGRGECTVNVRSSAPRSEPRCRWRFSPTEVSPTAWTTTTRTFLPSASRPRWACRRRWRSRSPLAP